MSIYGYTYWLMNTETGKCELHFTLQVTTPPPALPNTYVCYIGPQEILTLHPKTPFILLSPKIQYWKKNQKTLLVTVTTAPEKNCVSWISICVVDVTRKKNHNILFIGPNSPFSRQVIVRLIFSQLGKMAFQI